MRRVAAWGLGGLAILALVVSGTMPVSASPVNLLTNPGFETGDFTAWTVGGNSPFSGVATDGTPITGVVTPFQPAFVNVRSGLFAAFGGVKCTPAFIATCAPPVVLTLTQVVPVVPGDHLTVGFWLGNDEASQFGIQVQDTGLQILVDGVGLLPNSFLNGEVQGSTPADFQEFSEAFDAGSRTSVTVEFQVSGSGTGIAGVSLDDFFVTGAVASVPEPGSLLLLTSGLAGLAGTAWRARRRT